MAWAVTALLCAALGPVQVARAQPADTARSAPAASATPAPAGDPVDPVFEIERIEPPPASAPLPAPAPTAVPAERAYERPPILAPARGADSLADKALVPPSLRPVLGISYALGALLGVGATSLIGPAGLAFFAAPVLVHFIYLDPVGGVITLFAYPATVVTGALAGAALDTGECSDADGWGDCDLDGIVIGGALGAVTWSLIDVLLLAPRTWRGNHPPERSVAFDVLPGGGAKLRWSERF